MRQKSSCAEIFLSFEDVQFCFLKASISLYMHIKLYSHYERYVWHRPPRGRYFSLRKFLLFRERKESMDRGKEQVVKGNSETHCAKIVILLRAPAKPVLGSCSAAKLHLTQICLALFVNCPKSTFSWGCQSKLKEVFLTRNCLTCLLKCQTSFSETTLFEEWKSI